MSEKPKFRVDIENHDISYKKDVGGKLMDKFFLSLDKVLKNFKKLNNNSVTFIEGGEINVKVADKNAAGDDIVETLSSYAYGTLDLKHRSYNESKVIFEKYSFTINPDVFTEFRKQKGTNTPLYVEIVDQDYIEIGLIEGDVFRFDFELSDNEETVKLLDLMDKTEKINIDTLVMPDEHAQIIREEKATTTIKLAFTDKEVLLTDYYDFEYTGINGYYTLDTCKKYLVGFESRKRKDEYLVSEIEADLYEYPTRNGSNLIFILLRLINDTHMLEQTFISLDMLIK